MIRDNVVERTQAIFRDIFDDNTMVINDSISPDDIGNWDSLNHINLLAAIQKEFAIKFELSDLEFLNNAGAIINAILKKMGSSH